MSRMTGYLHPDYAASLSEFGEPLKLPRSGGWLLRRSIPGADAFDAMGCYPSFCCKDWSRLGDDLADVGRGLVSVSLVADPFGDHNPSLLRSVFERILEYKTHYVVDLQKPFESFMSASHREHARHALRKLSVEVCEHPADWLDTWSELYDHLIQRHSLRGIKAFSRAAFRRQLTIPGLVMFRVGVQGEKVGINLWYVQGEVAYAHLVALSPIGYELHAAYALKLAIFDYFEDKVRWLNLGGAAGLDNTANDGLAAFKRGWSSETRTAWFCGRILQPERYQEILRQQGLEEGDYFPAYRAGEFS